MPVATAAMTTAGIEILVSILIFFRRPNTGSLQFRCGCATAQHRPTKGQYVGERTCPDNKNWLNHPGGRVSTIDGPTERRAEPAERRGTSRECYQGGQPAPSPRPCQ